ncbi:polyprenyl synthetase family protein [uncultured Capnocytophaga sp.]|uniref:polyprenyl synthetase family protein n=1 Tax=uncultured Capnocytophaga sp. TaxID=159273 RepID=UPI0026264DEF|nr:polyprenyl synthetase family protein [uncultured Capnocytophaga sp.]
MQLITDYQNEFLSFLKEHIQKREPKNLYDPIQYILNVGGKRLRPVLTMLSTDIFGKDYHQALYAALAVEIFHNFSLVHDDIMDEAPLRRGQPTVHTKWNLNTGILSGDAMLILAYQYFERYEPIIFRQLAEIFSKTALEVCEGQQYDVDFEKEKQVSTSQYLKMITYKTAVLVGAALKMGAIIAETSEENKQKIYDFGIALGIAYQLQDDYLDTFGDNTFGKKIGGDILQNKKTLLYLNTLEKGSSEEKEALMRLYKFPIENEKEKIAKVTQLFISTGSDLFLRSEVENYTLKAFSILDTLEISEQKKEILKEFGKSLMNRNI